MNIRNGHGETPLKAQMDIELTRWLRGLEPTGTPFALRARTFSDLREEASRPRPRFVWLRPALSAAASLGAVILAAGLLLLVAVAGVTLDHSVGGTGPIAGPLAGQTGLSPDSGPEWAPYVQRSPDLVLLLVVVASALAGMSVFLPRVRAAARLIAVGRAEATPGAALPLRRPLRTIPRVAWALVAVGVVSAAWTVWLFVQASSQPGALTYEPWFLALSFCFLPVCVSVPAVVAWRYPLADRSGRLLLVGTTATLSLSLLLLFTMTVNLYQVPVIGNALGYASMYVYNALEVTSSVALAAGLARRSGSLRRPPLWLAAGAVGAAFFIEMAGLFDMLFQPEWGMAWSLPFIDLVTWVFGATCRWLKLVGLLAVAWVGVCAWRRRGGSWAWRLVLVAGTFELMSRLPNLLINSYNGFLVFYTPFGTIGNGDMSTMYELMQWQVWMSDISVVALLLALLSGLRPVAVGAVAPVEASAEVPEGEPVRTPIARGARITSDRHTRRPKSG